MDSLPWNILFCFLLWELWIRRNNWSFNKSKSPPSHCISKTKTAVQEFISTSQPHKSRPQKTRLIVSHLRPSNPGWSTFHLDASFVSIAGLAGCLRDVNNNWITGFEEKTRTIDARMAELLAIQRAFSLAKERDIEEIIFVSDCKTVVERINSSITPASIYRNIILSCRAIRIGKAWMLEYGAREGNKVADLMANYARNSLDFWVCNILDYPPPRRYQESLLHDLVVCTG